jgi:hypothetical protein
MTPSPPVPAKTVRPEGAMANTSTPTAGSPALIEWHVRAPSVLRNTRAGIVVQTPPVLAYRTRGFAGSIAIERQVDLGSSRTVYASSGTTCSRVSS